MKTVRRRSSLPGGMAAAPDPAAAEYMEISRMTPQAAVDNGYGCTIIAHGPADSAVTLEKTISRRKRCRCSPKAVPAPAFSTPNQDGTPTTLDQFAGRWLVLWWYPKADTPG